jgi:Holliday junction resolvasome RuvABC endonuclease subunit
MKFHDRFGPDEVRVVAIDPGGSKFGFAVLEGEDRLIDWGLRKVRKGRKAHGTRRVIDLLDCYRPDALIVEDVSSKHAGRSPRIRRLVKAVIALGAERKIPTYSFPRSQIRAVFLQAGAFTKEEIAGVVAGRFPALEVRLPPKRRPWMSEDNRINLFEAVALALTFFDLETKRRETAERDSRLDAS